MRVDLFRDCPGYAEAARREEEIRVVPFLGLEERIAGLPVSPLTLRRLQWLTMVRSPFLYGLSAETLIEKPGIADDIILLLWIVSPQFKAGNERAKRRFYKTHGSVLKADAAKVIQEIIDYVDESFLDSGAGEKGATERSYYSTAAALVGFFAANYGLPLDAWENSIWRNLVRRLTGKPNVMDIPLKIAFQLVRVHQRSKNPDFKPTNRLTQAAVDAWMQAKQPPRLN